MRFLVQSLTVNLTHEYKCLTFFVMNIAENCELIQLSSKLFRI